jgi:hypothetical protein
VLRAQALGAHQLLARGDSARALERLTSLAPSAAGSALTWSPWEALAGERMTLARLLLARGDYARAEAVAGQIDASLPVVHLMYLRPSLSLRAAAAQAVGASARAQGYRAELARLASAGGPPR